MTTGSAISQQRNSGELLTAYISESRHKCYVLPVKRVCNAACVFCATDEYKPESVGEFLALDGLASRIELLASHGVRVFEITGGGEPTLHPHLAEIVRECLDHGGYVKLYTNGARIKSLPYVDELNLSRCMFDPEQNQHLMKIRPASPVIADVVDRSRSLGIRTVRLSVPLILGGVDSLERAKDFVERASELVDAIVFRPLYPATPDREMWLPDSMDVDAWMDVLVPLAKTNECRLEMDQDGCFRSRQLILANDLSLYSDWSLVDRLPW